MIQLESNKIKLLAPKNKDQRQVVAWAFYDWANSAFATTVMAGFFPIFFKQFWNAQAPATLSTFRLGLANSIASLVMMMSAAILGAIADQGSAKKKFLFAFCAIGVGATGGLFFVGQGQWPIAMAMYILAVIGFCGGNLFYDSLLVAVAPPGKSDMVSALGYSLGYLGGGILFALNVWMTLSPATFGLTDETQAVRISFLCVALWWAIFSIPIMSWVQEPMRATRKSGWHMVQAGLSQLRLTFNDISKLKVVSLFLVSYWLYIDGVDTIVQMAVDYGMAIGFKSKDLIVALLITQFVGFPAALIFGKLGEKIGAKVSILCALSMYICVTVAAYFMDSIAEFYALAVAIGLVQGGVQSLSRSLFSRLIPSDKAAEFFGFYNMLGKFAAVLGPLLMGAVAVITQNSRLSILAIAVLFVLGGILLFFVNEEKGVKLARQLESKQEGS